ncbi:MAG: hypothetical protein QNJ44_21075 [Rhodobacter sp.]|nr:hypothetical protein [Rhodobacter sp.]
MKLLLALPAALILAGCAETQKTADAVARKGAKAAVEETLVRRFPQVPAAKVTPYSDCVIDNASAGEILSLAGDAVSGTDAGTAELVIEIATRPDTLKCLAGIGLPTLLL